MMDFECEFTVVLACILGMQLFRAVSVSCRKPCNTIALVGNLSCRLLSFQLFVVPFSVYVAVSLVCEFIKKSY